MVKILPGYKGNPFQKYNSHRFEIHSDLTKVIKFTTLSCENRNM